MVDPSVTAPETGTDSSVWVAERAQLNTQHVETIPFSALSGWDFDPGTGDLRHHTGRFFSVRGLRVRGAGEGAVPEWWQPVIDQPEIGVLGILAKRFDGVRHFLMQAKVEPGNVNGVQLSPTVQATRSNYTRVHRGTPVAYLEYFAGHRGRVLVDVLQSEQGSWFLRKRNRNMIVETDAEVPVHEDFRWFTLDEIRTLLRRDNMVNMDARTVLSCLPGSHGATARAGGASGAGQAFTASLAALSPAAGSAHSMTEVLSWFTEAKAWYGLTAGVVPLTGLPGWHRTSTEIAHDEGGYFRIIAVDVTAPHREVPRWTQPMLAPTSRGLLALLYRTIGDVPHFLVQARAQQGSLDALEIGPTVQCSPDRYRELPPEDRPPYLDHTLTLAARSPDRIRYDHVQSEEGGRFFAAENRYLVAEVEADFPVEAPSRFCWVTLGQLKELLRHSYYLNIEARTLVACVESLG
ncbi:NDP-hexose 2,3-dehydratase family protein [Streptomyces sp. NPDC050704]|uniref:NDP-hexose 2,3-dehydratase family protein n=1 Tax=Streptomyces sp. NPDC050704 TaxID=3157219 RepID=UPI00342F5844